MQGQDFLKEFENNVVVIEILSGPDNCGRHVFDIYRWSNTIGPKKDETGWKGQTFKADLNSHLKRIENQGKRIQLIKPPLTFQP